MSRLIDANKVVKAILAERDKIPYELVSEKPFNHGNSMRGGIRKALRCIEQAPTVDAVPVVRCRECKQGEIDDPDFPDQYYCHAGCGWNNGDFYCAYGEPKEGAE